jgi:Ca2+-binding RTX toxin-like protein
MRLAHESIHSAHVQPQAFALTTGADSIAGARGNDIVVATAGTLSAGDSIDGGGGRNVLLLSGAGSFDLSQPAVLAHIQLVQGANDDQSVTLRGGADLTYHGGSGNDAITSLTGNDVIVTGTGNDTVQGGSGNDLIKLGSGSDLVLAGSGHSTVQGGSGSATIIGGAGGDVLAGGSGTASIAGGTGNDTIRAGIGSDTVSFGGGHDVLKLAYSEDATGTILVSDFAHGNDRIDAGQFARNFADLQAHSTITASAAGLVIQIAEGPTLTLVGVTSVSHSDFVFWGTPH